MQTITLTNSVYLSVHLSEIAQAGQAAGAGRGKLPAEQRV